MSAPINSVLDDVAAVIGYTATRTLVVWYAGRSIYVPTNPRPDHPLSRLIGGSALRALVEEWGGEILQIPWRADENLQRDRRIAESLVAGRTCAEVAEDVGLDVRRVEQIRAELVERGWLEYLGGSRRRRVAEPV